MRSMIYRLFLFSFIVAAGSIAAAPPPVDFAAKIAPIFQEHCVDCHGKDDPDGELILESFESLMKGGKAGKAIIPGKAQDSLLVKFIEGRSGKEGKNQFMPPGKKEHLKPAEIALIRQWIDGGAPAPSAEMKSAELIARLPKISPVGEAKKAVRAVAFSEKLNIIAIGRFGSVELLNGTSREGVRVINDIAGAVNALVFSPDGQSLFVAAGDAGLTGVAYHFRATDGKLMRKLEGHTDALYAIALSPDGKVLATGGYDQKIKLWSTSTGIELKLLKGHNGCVNGLSFRPDGKVLASACADRTVKLWDVSTGARLDTLSQPLKEQYAVAFSPDGKTLAGGGADNRIRFWRVSEKALEGSNPILASRFAHEGAILSLLFAADGETLISSAADKTVKLWNPTELTERVLLEKQPDWTPALALLADERLIAGRLDGSLGFYDVVSGKPVTAAANTKPEAAKPVKPADAKMTGKPELVRAVPRGMKIGGTTRISVVTKTIPDVKSVNFSSPLIKAEIVDVKADGSGFGFSITTDSALKQGAYDFSVVSGAGETAKLKLYADPLPQIVSAKSEQPMVLKDEPVNVWGTLMETGQQDSYRVSAMSGQTLVFDLAAKRVESKAGTPRLDLFDAASGKRLASNSGLDSGSDPFLAFTAPKDGDYILRVSETTLEGSADHVYRLTAGALPFVVGFWPLSLPANTEGKVRLVGHNLPADIVLVKAGPAGEMNLPLDETKYRSRVPLKIAVSDMNEVIEKEPNDDVAGAAMLSVPVSINGRLHNEKNPDAADVDVFGFEAKQGQKLVIETRASMLGSPADTKIEVLDAKGAPVPQIVLQATRDSMVTFRGVDANNPDIRLENWQEMELNEYVYLNGDVTRIFRMPRGPDSGLLFFSNAGKRRSYFGTSSTSHALDEPSYIVEPKPIGSKLTASGLPIITLNYSNDDDAERELAKDSRLIFNAPAAGRYFVRVTDTRGWSGDRYAYRLIIRDAKPDYTVKLGLSTVNVSAGSAASFGLRADRLDGFDGDIRVDVSEVPEGFTVATPIIIQGGHLGASTCLHAKANAKIGTVDFSKMKFTASAMIADKETKHEVDGLTSAVVAAASKQTILFEPDTDGKASGDGKTAPAKPYEITIAPGQTVSAWLRADRKGYEALISLDVENLPHGVILDNIGLNGVQVRAGENEREIFLSCAKWVPDQDRLCFAVVGSARNDAVRDASAQASFPVLLKVRKAAGVADALRK